MKCPKCGSEMEPFVLTRRDKPPTCELEVCPKCGHEEKVGEKNAQ